jgi:hypothetical protein
MTQADSVHSTPPINTSALPDGLARQERERERALRRVAKLREKASNEIEKLLSFLDASDPYAATELEEAVDDGPCDGDADTEPSLGSFDRMSDQIKAWSTRSTYAEIEVDAEQDTADAEPSLGSLEWDNQTQWGHSARADLEEQCEDEGSAA